MNIPIYEIENNEHTGYFNIVDTSTGKRYGEYITYEDAEDALDNNTFDNSEEVDEIELPEGEYVVCREYKSYGNYYIMFSRGNLSDHVSYEESVAYSRRFNDNSIKVYSSMQKAKEVADIYNKISREKKLYKYANWKAEAKWW